MPQKRYKKRSLGTAVNGCTRLVSAGKDDIWAMDFVFDVTANDVIDVLRELDLIRGTPALAAGVQPPPAAQFTGLPDLGEICRDVLAATSTAPRFQPRHARLGGTL
jgi:hypothetical protein